MTSEMRTIQRSSRIGLYGAVAIIVLAAVAYSCLWHPSPSYTFRRWALVLGTILAVLSVSIVLLTVRKRIPMLRQSESFRAKLTGYAVHVRSVYLSMLGVVCVICALTVASRNSVLFMLAIVCTLVLILNFPNMYRIKVDLGLNDAEMHILFGDKYTAGNEH